MIQLGQPWLLLLLVVPGTLAASYVLLALWRRRARARFAGPQAARWPAASAWPQATLVVGAACLLVVAAARPQWGSRELQREREGFDLVIALDISQSMQARDASPSRLGLAQQELVRLVEDLRGNRIGLVLFAGTAVLRSPLTTDTGAMSELIRRADREGGLARAGSDIGAALDQAGRILEASDSPGKAVLVVSDGEDHVRAFSDKARALAAKGITLLSAGAGTPGGATIPETDTRGQTRSKLDPQGTPIISRLDEPALQALAAAGNGRYLRLGGEESLLSLRDDLARLDQTSLGAERQRIPIERFQIILAAALILLALAWFAPARSTLPRFASLRLRPGPATPVILVALLVGACGGGSVRSGNAEANRLFNDGDFAAALGRYQALLAERPDLPQLSFNAGNALHRLGQLERAATETQRALPPVETKLGARTYYALGNHYLRLGRFDDAYLAYRNSLLLDPMDGDAKHNLELTLLLLRRGQRPPTAGAGDPQQPGDPGDQQGQPGQPPPGPASAPETPGSPQQPGAPQQDARRTLEEALAGLEDELTFEEAVRILDALRQQQQRPQRGVAGSTAGPDY